MAVTKLQKRQERRKSIKIHVKTAIKEEGYTLEEFSKKLGISRWTLDKKLENPEELTVKQINMICQSLLIDKSYEMQMRGITQGRITIKMNLSADLAVNISTVPKRQQSTTKLFVRSVSAPTSTTRLYVNVAANGSQNPTL